MCIYNILVIDKVDLIIFQKTFIMSHRLLSRGVIIHILPQLLWKFSNNLGFWHDKCIMILYCPGMLIILFSIMNGHMFQSASEHKAIEGRPAPGDMAANQH